MILERRLCWSSLKNSFGVLLSQLQLEISLGSCHTQYNDGSLIMKPMNGIEMNLELQIRMEHLGLNNER